MKQSNALSITSLVLGVVGLFFSALIIGIIPGVIGLVLGIIALSKRQNKSTAIIGICSAGIGILVSFFVFIVAVLSSFSNSNSSVWAASPTPIDQLKYKKNPYDNTIIIEKYKGSSKKLWIDSSYSIDDTEYTVSEIDGGTFRFNTRITSVIIPEGITTIDNSSFNCCSSLKYLYLPSTIGVMNGGTTLIDYIDDYLEAIYYGGTDAQWVNVTQKVKPSILNYIAVYCNSSIGDSTILEGVLFDKASADQAIAAEQLTNVTGDKIDPDSYNNDENTSIWATDFTPIDDFYYTLDKENRTITLTRYQGDDTKILLSPVYTIDGHDYTLISLGRDACFLCETSITSIVVPENVIDIYDSTFNSCSSLKYLYLPSTLKDVDKGMFNYIDRKMDIYYGGTSDMWYDLTKNVNSDILNKYNVYCDSIIETKNVIDKIDYPELVDDRDNASKLGEDAGRAINGFLSGLLGADDE